MDRRNFVLSGTLATLQLRSMISASMTHAALNDSDTDVVIGSEKGPWRRLFLDSTVVESQHGLLRQFHSAEKHPANPLLVADRPWEGNSAIIGPYVYGTILREDGRLRMWYQLLFEGNHTGYAESVDGIQWTKPELDIFEYRGSKTNLVVSDLDTTKTGGHCHNPSVIFRPDADSNRRYLLYGFDNKIGRPSIAYSHDGLHWIYPKDDQPLFVSSDVVNFAYDPYQSRFYATWKTRNRRGRAVGIAHSVDGKTWKKPFDGPVFVADDLDPDDTQIYGMPVFPYQGMYIGLPWMYRARYFRYGQYSVDKLHEAQHDSPRTMEVQLAWSWDLVNWTRPIMREQFIPRGAAASWDGGMIVTARAPVAMGDQLFFYYGGTDKVHDEKRVKASIGLATMRLDGFCSMNAGDKEGWFISRREPMLEPAVIINAKTDSGGSITAEILDRKDRVIKGFSREQCIAFEGDRVSHVLRWKTATFPEAMKRTDYKIKFWLKRAKMYSYLPLSLDPQQPDLVRFPEAGP